MVWLHLILSLLSMMIVIAEVFFIVMSFQVYAAQLTGDGLMEKKNSNMQLNYIHLLNYIFPTFLYGNYLSIIALLIHTQ